MEQASGSAEDWVDVATVNTSVAHSDSSRTSARGAQQPSSSEGAGPLIEELVEVLGELKSYFRWPRAASGFRGFFWGGGENFLVGRGTTGGYLCGARAAGGRSYLGFTAAGGGAGSLWTSRWLATLRPEATETTQPVNTLGTHERCYSAAAGTMPLRR